MNRRSFLQSALAIGFCGVMPSPLLAAPRFASNRISVTVHGSGPDVIMIPGLTVSRAIWNGTVAAVPGYRYHLVQVAGFAGHPAGGNAKGAILAPLAAEIARYIDIAGLKAPALVGHSMGGTLAMMVAARHPGRAGKVMVVDMLPEPAGLLGASASGIAPLANSLRDLFGSSPGGRQLIGSLMGRFGSDEPNGPKSDPDVVARASHELALLDLTPELPRIAAPMTVVFATPAPGGNVPPERVVANYRRAYARAPKARLAAIANSGHMIMYDQPAKFRAELKAFLAG
jgi:N-formylmaleamate deformylase